MDSENKKLSLKIFKIKPIKFLFIAGFVFTVPFVLFGLQKLDHGAEWQLGFMNIINGVLFRCLITPAMCAFWPIFVVRLIRGKSLPTETNAHRKLAKQEN